MGEYDRFAKSLLGVEPPPPAPVPRGMLEPPVSQGMLESQPCRQLPGMFEPPPPPPLSRGVPSRQLANPLTTPVELPTSPGAAGTRGELRRASKYAAEHEQ